MTLLILAPALVAVALAWFLHVALRAVIDGAIVARDRFHTLDREHRQQVANIIADFSAERSEWAQERAVLLNRIQDPAATAFTSNVGMTPPAGDMSMEIVT